MFQHQQITAQQAEIVGIGMAEARQNRLLVGGECRQRFGGDPRFPAQFGLCKCIRGGFAAVGLRLGVPATGNGGGRGERRVFSVTGQQPVTVQQPALKTDKRDQLRQSDDIILRPAGLLQRLQLLRLRRHRLVGQAFGMFQRPVQRRIGRWGRKVRQPLGVKVL